MDNMKLVSKNKSKTLRILRDMEKKLYAEWYQHSPMGKNPNSDLAKSIGTARNLVMEQIDRLER